MSVVESEVREIANALFDFCQTERELEAVMNMHDKGEITRDVINVAMRAFPPTRVRFIRLTQLPSFNARMRLI